LLLRRRGLGAQAGDHGVVADLEVKVTVTAHRLEDVSHDPDGIIGGDTEIVISMDIFRAYAQDIFSRRY
jgi:hypothetical protein